MHLLLLILLIILILKTNNEVLDSLNEINNNLVELVDQVDVMNAQIYHLKRDVTNQNEDDSEFISPLNEQNKHYL